jgi:fibronectin-binding autotransporter adhesin
MPRVPSQKRRPAILASSVAAMLSISLLLGAQRAGADEYFDGTSTTDTGVANGAGGSGPWDTTTTNWVDVNGQNSTTYDPNTNAVFANNGGTVTLGNNISFSSLHFTATGYDVVGNGSTLTATGGGTITIDSGMSVTIDAQLTGHGQQHGQRL